MNQIRILSEHTAAQIAAGEVVERPSSVVRELMDNSIDAGADRIVVRVEAGGKRRVRVSDNGSGMNRDDLLLCVERHATSKIETADDLLTVRSLGFRGEAIPSIASVSRMRLTSRPADQLAGHVLTVNGGKLQAIEETGAPVGTIVDVEALFYNTPARRKFLRTDKTESNHLLDVFSRLALPFLDIDFRLEDRRATILDLPAAKSHLPRLSALMGRKAARALMEGEEGGDHWSVRVCLGPPELSRRRGDRLYVYVNGRHVRDRLLTRAIMEGYGRRLMKGQYPQAAVFVEMAPSEVDVNVHPTKQEVRFRNAQGVFGAVEAAVSATLNRRLTPVMPFAPATSEPSAWPPPRAADRPMVSDAAPEAWKPLDAKPLPSEPAMLPGMRREPDPQIIGQLGDTYILCQALEGLLVVDQHAAHERVVYETLKKGMEASGAGLQNLLIPIQVELNPRETRLVLEKGDQLARYGIELEHFGGQTFLIRAVPAILSHVDWEPMISELATELDRVGAEPDALMDKVLMVMACHGAIRASHRLSREEAEHLMVQLTKMDLPTNCPHGRPIFKRITYRDLEKMFKRIV
ncbi:MAG: DNA mismatch repair endonuclease MutL [Deltaproteobacteria bacterium]|nr:DNA mismatch repair endonuclease MutL [Deltaproteobacteria bacterium]